MVTLSSNTFGGHWYFPSLEKEFEGELAFSNEHKIFFLQAVIPPDEIIYRKLKTSEIDCIFGTLFNGAKIQLCQCDVRQANGNPLFGPQRFIFIPNLVFDGLKANALTTKFDGLQFEFDDIVSWLGLSRFKDHGDTEITWIKEPDLVLETDTFTLTIAATRTGTISFIPSREKVLGQTAYFVIQPREKQLLSWFMNIAELIKSFITLGVERKVCYHSISYIHESTQITHNGKNYPRPRPLYLKGQTSPNSKSINNYNDLEFLDYLFSFHHIKDKQSFFSSWITKYSLIRPVVDLVNSLFLYSDMPIEVLFLNLMQALETYHSRFVCDNPKHYSDVIDALLDEYHNLNGQKRLLRKDYYLGLDEKELISKTDSEKAETANYDCCKETRSEHIKKISLKMRVRYLFSVGDFMFLSTYKMTQQDFIDKLVISRNYYTHYDPKKESRSFTREELKDVCPILFNLANYYILKELGLPEENLHKIFGRRFDRGD